MICNPYITQADRLATSVRYLSDRYIKAVGECQGLTSEEIREIYEKVTKKVCRSCERRNTCLGAKKEEMEILLYEILEVVEKYGEDLNVETQRKLGKECGHASKYLRVVLDSFSEAKQQLSWNRRWIEERKGYANQLNQLAQIFQSRIKNLGDSIFADPPLEKKIKAQIKKAGAKVLHAIFLVNEAGHYSIYLTVRSEKGNSIEIQYLEKIVSQAMGRSMVAAEKERPVLLQSYTTIEFVEKVNFYMRYGIARIGRHCDQISGDNFLAAQIHGGKQILAISDGMGAGEGADRESAMVLEVLEELLDAGIPEKEACAILNTTLSTVRDEVIYSTLDLLSVDLYTGECQSIKGGAAPTLWKHQGKVERIEAESLPLGVIKEESPEIQSIQLKSGDQVILLTDGVLDALPQGEGEHLLELITAGASYSNPKEMAHHILEQILELHGAEPEDDMMVLVAGIWKIC